MTTIIKDLGYYTPSQANWSYRFHLIIDDTGARMYHDTFGGIDRLIDKLGGRDSVKVLSGGKGSEARYKMSNVRETLDAEQYNGKNYAND
jgi:hypothetical protein